MDEQIAVHSHQTYQSLASLRLLALYSQILSLAIQPAQGMLPSHCKLVRRLNVPEDFGGIGDDSIHPTFDFLILQRSQALPIRTRVLNCSELSAFGGSRLSCRSFRFGIPKITPSHPYNLRLATGSLTGQGQAQERHSLCEQSRLDRAASMRGSRMVSLG